MMFIQIAMNLGLLCDIANVKNAFCQSDRMHRAQGEIYVELCRSCLLQSGNLNPFVFFPASLPQE
eukprot:1269411-Pyramimonas_sp.AAC.1